MKLKIYRRKFHKSIIYFFWACVVKILKMIMFYKPVNNKSVLVIDFELLGDSVMVTSIFKNIKQALPKDDFVDVLCYTREMEIFKRCNYVDHIYTIDRPERYANVCPPVVHCFPKFVFKVLYWKYIFRFIFKNLLNKYNTIIVPRYDVDVEYTAKISKIINSNNRFAFSENCIWYKSLSNCGRDRYFTKVFKYRADCLEVDKFLWLINQIGYDIINKYPCIEHKKILKYKGIDLTECYVVIAVDTSRYEKEWGMDNFIKVALYLNTIGYKVLFLGTRKEYHEYFLQYGKHIKGYSLIGVTSVEEAIDIIGNCSFYIGCDTGLSHVAGAVGVQGIVIWSNAKYEEPWYPSSVVRMKPKSKRIKVVQANMPITPCKTHCICTKAHCIRQITVNEVIEAIEKVLMDRKIHSSNEGRR
ncbi:MAG: glycosyltransferase family 9 protein [Phascolarctobacterium sp.]|nr:glycosyltransferase family 9 protein [Phascolarctobacterium sp.]